MNGTNQTHRSPWPHRLAVALALVTFPLIWVGGLVTTYQAGMAVPDWPSTYGYNLFLYPWQTWIAGPWNIFIEHGHRLLGATAGMVAIALVVVVLCLDRRRWLIQASLGALALVIFQGLLGGFRVLLDERLIAMVHACVGPLFFAYLAGLVIATSRWWEDARSKTETLASSMDNRLVRASWITVALAYGQLILGAIVRHVPLWASPQVFRGALLLHLVIGGLLTLQIGLVAWQAWKANAPGRRLGAPAFVLVLLVALQLALGLGTYVARYGFPAWLADCQFAAAYVVERRGLWQAMVTTAHVANGSLILFAAVWLSIRATRLCVGPCSAWTRSSLGADQLAKSSDGGRAAATRSVGLPGRAA
jgi:heme a synthase